MKQSDGAFCVKSGVVRGHGCGYNGSEKRRKGEKMEPIRLAVVGAGARSMIYAREAIRRW